MSRILVTYASAHGHTARIAARMAEQLGRAGGDVTVGSLAAAPEEIDPADYDAVIVGASVHAGHHQQQIVDWVREHAGTLNAMPSAFFSVCLTGADAAEKARAVARGHIAEFESETGWTPRARTTVPGALQHGGHSRAARLLMRALMRRGGRPSDARSDYVHTDWKAVEEFALEFAALAGAVERPARREGRLRAG